MAARTNTINGVIMAVELMRRIPRGRKVTVRELHDQLKEAEFPYSIRTIQRTLQELCLHFPIEQDQRSKPYGYSWAKEASGLDIVHLSAQEALLLTLAQQQLKNLLPQNLFTALEGFFNQAQKQLQYETNHATANAWLDKVRVVSGTQPLLPPHIEPEIFKAVSKALYYNHYLELNYTNSNNKTTQSKVTPLALVQQEQNLYLVCIFKDYKEPRILAIHRIKQAKCLNFRFERPDFNLETYQKQGGFGFSQGEKIYLTFHISENSGKHLLETPLSEDQKVQEINQKTLKISATVIDNLRLERWLLSFGNDISHIQKKPIQPSKSKTTK